MNYAKIIDKGECYSSLNLNVNGIPANRNEWMKYNFYPKNNMVGMVLNINGYIILKIDDNIYVPISSNGIRYISETEYYNGLANNIYSGMDVKQEQINNSFDEAISRPYSIGKPNYKEYFWKDIVNNLTIHTNNYTKPMFMPQLMDECVMYACDICLEFKKKAGFLSNDWMKHISSQVCDVFDEHFKEFGYSERTAAMDRIERLLNSNYAESEIQKFYNR
ncbi:MAG: hypothetical protein ACLTOV_01105 [Phocaeicola sp.]